MEPVIIVHGGAGSWDSHNERLNRAVTICQNAAQSGFVILEEGGSALDAAETSVRVLEDSPLFDAGRGSYLNSHGGIEMDALIVDGSSLDFGAVAAVQRVRNPITVARLVMTKSKHNFLVGLGADTFAETNGIARCDIDDLITESQLKIYEEFKSHDTNQSQENQSLVGPFGDTVGAVALDVHGNLASATSTGGINFKEPGRVGDSPLIGCGGYADNRSGAVSATGQGEALMKVVISKTVCDFITQGYSTQEACDAAIRILAERVGGQGGLIAIDQSGVVGFAHNTVAMPYAIISTNGGQVAGS